MVVERGAADRGLEITQPTAQLPADLWKPFRTKHQKRDDEDEQQMRWLKNVADHNQEVSQLQVWRRLSFGGCAGAPYAATARALPGWPDRTWRSRHTRCAVTVARLD